MARELTLTELANIEAAVNFLRRLKDCCPSLAANDDFLSAFGELEATVGGGGVVDYWTVKKWWVAGEEGADSMAETERRLWVLWVKHVWIRPDILHGDRVLSLNSCDGREIARLAFIMLHEAYHIDGWVDGEDLARQDLQNLTTWELNLISVGGQPPPCQNFPCADKVLEYVKAQMQETVNTINGLPWYKRWFNWNFWLKWLGRFAFGLIAVVLGGFLLWLILLLLGFAALAAKIAAVGLGAVLLIALIITLVWMVLEWLFG
ncbi:MAG: hypothetical protein O3A57_12325 [Bacteroidetes bacterium]|nr:hypothetical protein [Bacteroidota bacterium]